MELDNPDFVLRLADNDNFTVLKPLDSINTQHDNITLRALPALIGAYAHSCGLMRHWLRSRPFRLLDRTHAKELGVFDDDSGSHHACVDPQNYSVKHVFFKPLSKQNISGAYYASSATVGGWETFWRFQFHTLTTHRLCDEMSDWKTSASQLCGQPTLRAGGFALRVDDLTRAKMVDVVDEWCRAHPGRFGRIHAPGNRDQVDARLLQFHTYEQVFCYSPDGENMRA